MSIAPYIKEIGRGKEGARSLDQAQSYDLMRQVLDGTASDLEIGAFAIAMRIKGESTAELAGFLAAVLERCMAMPVCTAPAVVLPSYNGARKLPNLTPLLAGLLAREGLAVLVHGPLREPGRVGSADIVDALGWPIARSSSDVAAAWAGGQPVFVGIETLCPPLARLLAVRRVIGLRNPGHTVAKLLDPTEGQQGLRVVNHTHPEYNAMLAAFLQHTHAHALLLRGTEGEPVADPRRLPRLDVFIHGRPRPDLSQPAQEGSLSQLPSLPRQIDAASTAHYIRTVLSGEQPPPAPLVQQVRCIVQAVQASQAPAAPI